MAWGKCLIIILGWMLVTHVAYARDIETFTDGQGTLHITNIAPKKPSSPVTTPHPAASFEPGGVIGKAPVTAPARQLDPEAQAPAPKPEAVPAVPIPATPSPGSRVTHTEGLGRVMQMADRTGGQDEPGMTAGPPGALLKRVSWSAPQPVKPVTNGKITIYRDRQGVIHITNVIQEGEEPATPVPPAPVAQKQAPPLAGAPPALQMVSCPVPGPALAQRQLWPPGPARPAVQKVSCPEIGPEVANYLEAKLLAHAPALTGNTIQRYKDHRDVWHISNDPSPDAPLPQGRLAASAGQITAPVSVHGPPGTPTPPDLARGAGWLRPTPGDADQKVVARRDRRGILHIFTCASPGVTPGQGSPLYFLGKVSPALQACIIEAAQQYRLPISLVLAIIRKESDFSHRAVSPKGAMGLMQLMPGTAASLGVRDPFDPRENILAGCRYFRSLLDSFQGNVPLALAGYNAGSHRVITAGFQVPAIKETQEFVTQVMGLYYLLEKQADSL